MRARMRLHRQRHRLQGGKRYRVLVHHRSRRLLATADARRGDDAHIVTTQNRRKPCQQVPGARHLAAQAVAHTYGQRRRLGIALEDFEVVIESGDLKDLGHADAHFFGQRHQVPVVQAAVMVLQAVQMLDQQVSRMRAGTQQIAHLLHRDVIRLAALELAFAADALAHIVYRAQRHAGHRTRRCRHVHWVIVAQ